MEYRRLVEADMEALEALQAAYKREIGEDAPTAEDLDRLRSAVEGGEILFYGCEDAGRVVGCCSVSPTFSTFDYRPGGVFEDFYIIPEYRHRGIARGLVECAFRQSGAGTMTVGCADCDVEMYRALGFGAALGNMLAYGG